MSKLLLSLSLPLFLALGFAALPAPILAQSKDELTEIGGDKPITLRDDHAYFLFRTRSGGVSPVFLRIPSDAEMQAYDAAKREAFAKAEPALIRKRQELITRKETAEKAGRPFSETIPPEPAVENFNFVWDKVKNAQTVRLGRAMEKTGDERTLLIEAPPGTYVFYGMGYGDIFHTCLCLGTVSFTAQAGRIADLGTILIASASEKTDLPELAGETGFGPSMNGHLVTWAAAIRPATASTPLSPLLAGKPIAPADFRATGKFVAGFSFGINRLAPIPGVLGYDRGNVLDRVENKVAANQY